MKKERKKENKVHVGILYILYAPPCFPDPSPSPSSSLSLYQAQASYKA
jgi:hypothetical protein